MQQKSDMQMRELSPYSAAFTREQFLFYEMRVTAKLLCEGLEAGEVKHKNLFSLELARVFSADFVVYTNNHFDTG